MLAQIDEIEAHGGAGALDLGGGATLEVSNLDKPYFPKAGHTKGGILRYYAAVSPYLLPWLLDRPLVLRRTPEGVNRQGFYQQKAPERTPTAVRTEAIPDGQGRLNPRIVGGSLATLLYLVQLGAIEMHPWHSRVGSLSSPDYAVLDLDPGPASSLAQVARVATRIHETLERFEIRSGVKTSGGRGLHVVIPLPRETGYDLAAEFTEIIARHVAGTFAGDATVVRALSARPPDTVYVDHLQNAEGKSVAAALSLRAREPAAVSTPLAWTEVTARLDPRAFRLETIPRDARRRALLWNSALVRPRSLHRITRAMRALD